MFLYEMFVSPQSKCQVALVMCFKDVQLFLSNLLHLIYLWLNVPAVLSAVAVISPDTVRAAAHVSSCFPILYHIFALWITDE